MGHLFGKSPQESFGRAPKSTLRAARRAYPGLAVREMAAYALNGWKGFGAAVTLLALLMRVGA
jgi:hypothetical protein